jgi:hypothetical protein
LPNLFLAYSDSPTPKLFEKLLQPKLGHKSELPLSMPNSKYFVILLSRQTAPLRLEEKTACVFEIEVFWPPKILQGYELGTTLCRVPIGR